ncbi:LacI family DNA-binding transcriptional regulator [Actinotalea sp. K2]|uniref:LacI family DNA-binding transcriptional regulator n=1 Tax=Actinotalea sp. K2 TaxID=2939438 RepID=UPI0020173724|nr:LacI family DNA-binding transcriptional regulator [Actinotalea sp. K2]
MAATLTDVAQAAGVSLATASRAFKEPDRLAASTRARVQEAAADLGYGVTAPQRSLTFAVVVPDAANPVFAALIAAIQEQAWNGRHKMILANTAEHPAREQEILTTIGLGVSGVILASPRLPSDVIKSAIGLTPLVVINAAVDFCPSVLMGADAGISQAFEHLHALGHRHVAYVPGPANAWANQRRHEVATEVATQWGMRLTVVGNQSATVEGGLAAAAPVVSSGATAVLAYNDLVALGLQSGARSLGLHCPRDLSIIGIDDLNIAAVAVPGLTSIRVDIAQGGTQAFTLLTDLIGGKGPAPREDHRTSQLIVRGSTDAPPVRAAADRDLT